VFIHLQRKGQLYINESLGIRADLCLYLVRLIAYFFDLFIILSSLDDHLVILLLQSFNGFLTGKFLVFSMFLCPLELAFGVGQLVVNALA